MTSEALRYSRRQNHWKRGVPQNPDSWAYKVYHYHLDNSPGTIKDICRGIGMPVKQSEKVSQIIKQLRRAKTWQWPNRPDREQAERNQIQSIASRHGEEI